MIDKLIRAGPTDAAHLVASPGQRAAAAQVEVRGGRELVWPAVQVQVDHSQLPICGRLGGWLRHMHGVGLVHSPFGHTFAVEDHIAAGRSSGKPDGLMPRQPPAGNNRPLHPATCVVHRHQLAHPWRPAFACVRGSEDSIEGSIGFGTNCHLLEDKGRCLASLLAGAVLVQTGESSMLQRRAATPLAPRCMPLMASASPRTCSLPDASGRHSRRTPTGRSQLNSHHSNAQQQHKCVVFCPSSPGASGRSSRRTPISCSSSWLNPSTTRSSSK